MCFITRISMTHLNVSFKLLDFSQSVVDIVTCNKVWLSYYIYVVFIFIFGHQSHLIRGRIICKGIFKAFYIGCCILLFIFITLVILGQPNVALSVNGMGCCCKATAVFGKDKTFQLMFTIFYVFFCVYISGTQI